MDILFHDRDHEHARSLDNSKVTEVSAKATIKKLVPASYEEGRLMTDLEYFTFDHLKSQKSSKSPKEAKSSKSPKEAKSSKSPKEAKSSKSPKEAKSSKATKARESFFF